jgi:murein L,D-transpeptidase YafK
MKIFTLRDFPAVLIIATVFSTSCVQSVTTAPSNASTGSQSIRNSQDEFVVNEIPLKLPLSKPKIVVIKSMRRLMLYSDDKLVRRYRVGLGSSPIDDKTKEGDRRTPEGSFYVFTKNEKSAYYLSLGLSYPNIEDAERGLHDGLINRDQYNQIVSAVRTRIAPPQDTPLGGQIYIHGNGSQNDWTWGCVALDDKDIRELFDAVPTGTEVIIEH